MIVLDDRDRAFAVKHCGGAVPPDRPPPPPRKTHVGYGKINGRWTARVHRAHALIRGRERPPYQGAPLLGFLLHYACRPLHGVVVFAPLLYPQWGEIVVLLTVSGRAVE